MLVRLVMPEDRDAVLRLAEMQVKETLPHLDFRPDLAASTFEAAITTADPTAFVAEDRGEVVGFLVCRMYEYTFASGIFVSQEVIYVRPDKRGTRAAVKLLREYIHWGEIVGAREILFGISNGVNPERAARLFEHMGAERVGFHHRIIRG